jgi:hypothetical protein
MQFKIVRFGRSVAAIATANSIRPYRRRTGGMKSMDNTMPIRAEPFKHQQEAFEFALRAFGEIEDEKFNDELRKAGDENENLQK